MALKDYLFTSESVSEGHPDKVADQISDAVLDEHLKGDRKSRVALETLVTTNRIVLSGEITSSQKVDYEKIARSVVAGIGYTDPEIGFDASTCEVSTYVHAQSSDISQGVTEGEGLFKEQGAGDQGMMFGYAGCGNRLADAHANFLRPQAGAVSRGSEEEGRAQICPARFQVAGDSRIPGRQAEEDRRDRHIHPAYARRGVR
jgi:tRNA threonylcarbamoyladenosine modification (KEOPS) complex  Pcc1 subunit